MDRIERSAAVAALTPDERAMLETQLAWVTCPVCEGSVVGKPLGHFCMACGTSGKVVKNTANVLGNMIPFIEAWRKRDAEPSFTREDVEKAAIGMFNLRQGQRGTPNITFDQCVMLRDDWIALATAALSAIGDVGHG